MLRMAFTGPDAGRAEFAAPARPTHKPEPRRAQDAARRQKCRRVRHVERFGAELQFPLLSDRNILQQREVDIHHPIPPEDIDTLVAKRIRRRLFKRIRVEPAAETSLAAGQIRVARYIRPQRTG